MSPVLPVNPGLIHQLEIGLVYQSGGIERVVRSFVLELPVRQSAELSIHQGKEAIHRLGVAPTDLEEKFGDRLTFAIGPGFVGCQVAPCLADSMVSDLKMGSGTGLCNNAAGLPSMNRRRDSRSPAAAQFSDLRHDRFIIMPPA
jgi:hypothetical protein